MNKATFMKRYPDFDWKAASAGVKQAIRFCEESLLDSMLSGKRIFPCGYGGKGKNTRCIGSRYYYVDIAKALGYETVVGNDAPKGGHWGQWVEIKPA